MWTTDWPDEVGYYWAYGQWKRSDKTELFIVRVTVAQGLKGKMIFREGGMMWVDEPRNLKFLRIAPPELPE